MARLPCSDLPRNPVPGQRAVLSVSGWRRGGARALTLSSSPLCSVLSKEKLAHEMLLCQPHERHDLLLTQV